MTKEPPSIQYIDPSKVIINDAICGKEDLRLLNIYELALDGTVPIFRVKMELSKIVPFDKDCRPDLLDGAGGMIGQLRAEIQAGRLPTMVIYRHQDIYIMSDEYSVYYAYKQLGISRVECLFFGLPIASDMEVIEGPLVEQEVKRFFGITSKSA